MPEIIIIIVVLGVSWLLFRLFRHTTWFERFLSRLVARRFAPDFLIEAPKEPGLIMSTASVILFGTIVLVFALLAKFGKLTVTVLYDGSTEFPAVWALYLLSYGCLLAAILIHWAGPVMRLRRIKYELFLSFWGCILSAVILEFLGILATPRITSYNLLDLGKRQDIPIPWQSTLWMLAAPAMLLAASAVIRQIFHRIGLSADAHKKAARWNCRLQPIGKWLVILSLFPIPYIGAVILPCLLFYFLVRYEIKALLLRRPILYLRSFHSKEAQTAFSKIVVPVATRYGVLAGLVSGSQPAHMLQRDVSALERGQFIEVDTQTWRNWVTKALIASHSVVIDTSHSSDNVAWELEQALKIMGQRRIAVIAGQGEPATRSNDEPQLINYSLVSQDIKAARLALAAWFVRLLEAGT